MKTARAKGSTAERKVAALLQAWWRSLESEAVFFRTPASGAWASTHTSSGMKARGDIMVNPETCKLFDFSVEVKHRAVITPIAIEHFVDGKKSPINGYWKQCTENAEKDGLQPMLVFRGNRQEWKVALMQGKERVVLYLEHLMRLTPEQVRKWRDM